ncbi:hypothetical protein HK102_000728 [Quaeritorhiza haematococci]|nr:hypothetical protein HK102_000728 [Quaeritorhiza haematococci]
MRRRYIGDIERLLHLNDIKPQKHRIVSKTLGTNDRKVPSLLVDMRLNLKRYTETVEALLENRLRERHLQIVEIDNRGTEIEGLREHAKLLEGRVEELKKTNSIAAEGLESTKNRYAPLQADYDAIKDALLRENLDKPKICINFS